MEIVPVSPFDAVAAEAKPPQGLTPEGPFRDCLGAALCHGQGGDPRSSQGAKATPAPERKPAEEVRAAPPPAVASPDAEAEKEGLETDTAGLSVAADLGPGTDPLPEDAAAACEAAASSSGKDAAVPVPAGLRETEAPVPPVNPAEKPLANGTPVEQRASPVPTPSPVAPLRADPEVGESQTVKIQANQSQETSTSVPGAAPAALAAAAGQQVPTGEVLPDASAPEQDESHAEGSRADRVRARAAVAFQRQVGAERLWGYWLRGGGAAAARPGPGDPRAADGGLGGETHLRGESASPETPAYKWAVTEASPEAAGAEQKQGVALPPSPAARPEAATAPGPMSAQHTERGTSPAGIVSRPPPAPPQPPQQIANAVRIAVLQGGDRVTLQLEPETLGKVHVVLMHSDEGVRASFRVESPLTQQALQADTVLLKQALEARGVNVAHVSVELDQGDRQARDPLGRNARGHRRRQDDGQGDAEMLMGDLDLPPGPWRPWGFEARV